MPAAAAIVAARHKEQRKHLHAHQVTASAELPGVGAGGGGSTSLHHAALQLALDDHSQPTTPTASHPASPAAEKSVKFVELPEIKETTPNKKRRPSTGSGMAAVMRQVSSVATLAKISEAERRAQLEGLRFPWFWRYQLEARWFYKHIRVQVTVAALIAGNFLVNMIEKQIDPKGTEYVDTFKAFELFFNIAFTIELLVNMYAFWCKRFWSSGWNIFDVIVVSIGILTTTEAPLPGPFKLLRIMRAFRVFRLFKRVESLRQILASLARAMPGVINAFIILMLVMSIYAMLAVDFFKDFGNDGVYINESGGEVEPFATFRGQGWGNEYYGNFMKSLYTQFQVLMGDAWSEACVRVLIHRKEDWQIQIASGLFYTSFVIVNAIVLVNVVVAVLLEKMMGGKDDEADQDQRHSQVHGSHTGVEGKSEQVVVAKDVAEIKADLADVRANLESVLLAIGGLRQVPPAESVVASEAEPSPGQAAALQGQLPGQVADSSEMMILGLSASKAGGQQMRSSSGSLAEQDITHLQGEQSPHH
mmetsp:Transcript_32391/g.76084  ORF Transcript_32391/g.76084 Transcript_32391/m.76084 type:complete len:532 (-) Transcript_32391:101-1696(-)